LITVNPWIPGGAVILNPGELAAIYRRSVGESRAAKITQDNARETKRIITAFEDRARPRTRNHPMRPDGRRWILGKIRPFLFTTIRGASGVMPGIVLSTATVGDRRGADVAIGVAGLFGADRIRIPAGKQVRLPNVTSKYDDSR